MERIIQYATYAWKWGFITGVRIISPSLVLLLWDLRDMEQTMGG
jgi:hypothetical protein